jgi:hypothetical protein
MSLLFFRDGESSLQSHAVPEIRMAAHARFGPEVLLDANLANHQYQAAAGNGTIAGIIERPERYAQDGRLLSDGFEPDACVTSLPGVHPV